MSKKALKARILSTQGGKCALSGESLGEDSSLYDTDRITERFRGGTYTDENTRVVDPRAHMERHGTLRDRDPWLAKLKALFDDRVQTMKLKLKIDNQLRAYKRRTDDEDSEVAKFLMDSAEPASKRLLAVDRQIEDLMSESEDELVRAALAVPGLGPVTVAALTVYVDLAKADSPSSLWKYCGLHAPAWMRYEKGVAGGGNKTLRTALWNAANVMMRMRASGYRALYDSTKARLAATDRVVRSVNTQGRSVEVPWSGASPGHRHGAALRVVMKHILADYWRVGRTVKGLSTRPVYAEARLGRDGIFRPEDRGWPKL